MDDSRLPIDVCEQVIDACYYQSPVKFVYPTWRATALVCSAWLPRSRFNLLFEVDFSRDTHVDLLLRTLRDKSHLATLVFRVTVDNWHPVHPYVPFSRMPLPLLLNNCRALDLLGVRWNIYPPKFADTSLRSWSGLEELTIRFTPAVLPAILRFIWSLPRLRALYIHYHQATPRDKHLPAVRPTTRIPATGTPTLQSLGLRVRPTRLISAVCLLTSLSSIRLS